jgi:BirA family biotin operon repressor/biotin-[acetyl-CoA-carboxylase] ligase
MSNPPEKHPLSNPLQDTQCVGRAITYLPTVGSTNAYALENLQDGAVYIADEQTQGRGRQGNAWNSQTGLGLWFSTALEGPPQGLTFAAALAVRDAIAPRATLKIKWPNDLLFNNKKIVGMLVEHRNGWSALGIGINVFHKISDFSKELQDTAGSLAQLTGEKWDRPTLFQAILRELDKRVLQLRQGNYETLRNEWAVGCDIIGRNIHRGDIEGTVEALDNEGALIVNTATGRHRIVTGEIQITEKN